nr:hypothetical protein [Paraburkholderia sp. ZP32-5]
MRERMSLARDDAGFRAVQALDIQINVADLRRNRAQREIEPPIADLLDQHLRRDADRSPAIEEGLAHVDLQPLFGHVEDYRFGTPGAWLDASLLHPAMPGRRAIEALYLSLFDPRE